MIKQIAHVCIHSLDLAETARFYIDALGLERGFEFFKDGVVCGYYLKLGSLTFIEVFHGDPSAAGNISHLALEVDNMDDTIRRVREHGYTASEKHWGADHAWQAWLEDPSGVRIELQEYTPDSLQLQGGQCHLE